MLPFLLSADHENHILFPLSVSKSPTLSEEWLAISAVYFYFRSSIKQRNRLNCIFFLQKANYDYLISEQERKGPIWIYLWFFRQLLFRSERGSMIHLFILYWNIWLVCAWQCAHVIASSFSFCSFALLVDVFSFNYVIGTNNECLKLHNYIIH